MAFPWQFHPLLGQIVDPSGWPSHATCQPNPPKLPWSHLSETRSVIRPLRPCRPTMLTTFASLSWTTTWPLMTCVWPWQGKISIMTTLKIKDKRPQISAKTLQAVRTSLANSKLKSTTFRTRYTKDDSDPLARRSVLLQCKQYTDNLSKAPRAPDATKAAETQGTKSKWTEIDLNASYDATMAGIDSHILSPRRLDYHIGWVRHWTPHDIPHWPPLLRSAKGTTFPVALQTLAPVPLMVPNRTRKNPRPS